MKDVHNLERDPHTKLELSTSIFENVHQEAVEENEKLFNATFDSFKDQKAFKVPKSDRE